MEEWVELVDFPGYMISNTGQVYSWKTETLLRPRPSGWGYLQVMFWQESRSHTKSIHLLVAHAFVPGWDYTLEPNHIDGNKQNNHDTNLEWVTKRENNIHALTAGLRRPRSTPVVCVDTGETFPSIKVCASYFGLWSTSISAVCRGTLKTSGGLRFRYDN